VRLEIVARRLGDRPAPQTLFLELANPERRALLARAKAGRPRGAGTCPDVAASCDTFRVVGVHRDFPKSPYAELPPDQRWSPAAEELRHKAYERLVPPLVARIREEVFRWRRSGYDGASPTPRALLAWWFERAHHKTSSVDATTASHTVGGPAYRFVFVDRAGFEKHTPGDLAGLAKALREFQE